MSSLLPQATVTIPCGSAPNGSGREKRWAVICLDGSHAWLGRHTDPDEAQLASVVSQLQAISMPAWLVVTEGIYHQPSHELSVIMVRPLSGDSKWDQARLAFLDKRSEAMQRI